MELLQLCSPFEFLYYLEDISASTLKPFFVEFLEKFVDDIRHKKIPSVISKVSLPNIIICHLKIKLDCLGYKIDFVIEVDALKLHSKLVDKDAEKSVL